MKHHPVTLIHGIGCCIDYYILHKVHSSLPERLKRLKRRNNSHPIFNSTPLIFPSSTKRLYSSTTFVDPLKIDISPPWSRDPAPSVACPFFRICKVASGRIAIKCDNHFLCVEKDGSIVANRTEVKEWETLVVEN